MIKKQNYKLNYGTDVIEYSVVKTRRRKTSEVIVDKNTVEVRAPLDKPDHEIEQVVRNKAGWIFNKQKEYREMNLHITKPTFGENSTLPYLGKNYHFKVLGRQKNNICFIDGEFIITLFTTNSKNPVKLYRETLRTLAHEDCETYFYEQSQIILRKDWHSEGRKNFYQEVKKQMG